MKSDSLNEIDKTKLGEALKKFFEDLATSEGTKETVDNNKRPPFDPLMIYTDGDEEPVFVDPKTKMGEYERLWDEAEDKRLKVDELLECLGNLTHGDLDLAATLMKKGMRILDNKNKQKDPCRIIVKEKGIYVELPDKELKKVTFGRGNLSKTLYIFFLRQLVRAEKDNSVSSCLSQFEMEGYKKELLEIYQNISGKQGDIKEVESWLETSTTSNSFANANASIRKYFDKFFDMFSIKYLWKKCYSIEIMGEDRYHNPRYGIKLSKDDFVLNWPFDVH